MIRLLVDFLEFVLNAFYRKRLYARFYVLETVARVPYFAFLLVLHFYESLGWWRKSDWLKVHFAESWNELHHLLIAESLVCINWH
ncbi:MAG: alternative oxidase [Nostoc sp. S4]|nr:alternative oxidase [Nostoc sp. S4]